MLRIFHVPSHLAYVVKLTAAEFGPVLSPAGRPLRPNRDLVTLVRAWRTLPKPQPPLRVLVRSLTQEDRQRYGTVLVELEQARRIKPGLAIARIAPAAPRCPQ